MSSLERTNSLEPVNNLELSNELISLADFTLDIGQGIHINALEIAALVLVALATLMCLYRLIFGPSNPDRIVSADALSVITTVILCSLAALFQSILYLDVALIYGVLSFVGMIALARVIEGGKN